MSDQCSGVSEQVTLVTNQLIEFAICGYPKLFFTLHFSNIRMLVAEVDARAVDAAALVQQLSVVNVLYARLSAAALASPQATDGDAGDAAFKAALLDARALVGPFSCDMMAAAASWLDKGARRVLVAATASDDEVLAQAAAAVSELPAARVVLRVPVDAQALATEDAAVQLRSKVERLAHVVAGVVLALEAPTSGLETAQSESDEFSRLFAALQTVRKGLPEGAFFAVEFAAADRETFDRALLLPRIAELHHKGIHVVAPALPVVTDEAQRSQFVDAGRAFIQCLRSDRPDGLFTTVVADERGVALGLVYSSEESVLAAIASGRGVYYSRSRQGLWKKGESSGNFQALVQLDVDCDSDALRFTVEQTGAGFCHLNTRTCWGEAGGVQHLQSMLASRLQDAPEGSYTKRLFSDPELLRNKLVEEAQELAEAESVPDVAGEAADVLYFAMVRCVAAGVTLTDIEVHSRWCYDVMVRVYSSFSR